MLKNVFLNRAGANFFNFQFLGVLFLGIISSIPFVLVHGTLNSWLAVIGLKRTVIGLFALLNLPYSFKFLWAVYFENYKAPIFSRYFSNNFSWYLWIQALLVISIISLSFFGFREDRILHIACICLFVAFLSASQDIVLDGYRLTSFSDREQGMASSFMILGYRVGMLMSGGILLIFIDQLCAIANICNDYTNWRIGYLSIILLSAIMTIMLLFIEKRKDDEEIIERNCQFASDQRKIFLIIEPIKDFFKQVSYPLLVLFFVAIYRLPDASIAYMMNPFFIDQGFSLSEIGTITKLFGFFAAIFGSFIAGILIYNSGGYIGNLIIIAAILQMLSNAMFIIQSYFGHDLTCLMFTISIENICSGFATSCLIAFVSAISKRGNYPTSQYSLLTSVFAVEVIFFSSLSGLFADLFEWNILFITSILLGFIPLLLSLYMVRKNRTLFVCDVLNSNHM